MSPFRGTTPDSSTTSSESTPRLVALCHHEPPGEPPHLDFFLGPENPDFGDEDPVLSSWRLPTDPRTWEIGGGTAVTSTFSHRGLYARLSAPRMLDGNRGLVTPVTSGQAVVRDGDDGTGLILEVEWADGPAQVFELRSNADGEQLRRIT